ncbi:hypothetical protein ASG25_10565 [Rhizobium sp. Leaf384]|uniref:hypothetical protein n=1 Tax=Rhizobium sp. Leaf384 TaxID=1736358 RepID=UPI000715AD6B|nr:hypothetical protein [Rhizobium sp. Leaf384]KQS79023.1 hypothetical protein ASG25_10565 [Rhizobium sp. Leaf384]
MVEDASKEIVSWMLTNGGVFAVTSLLFLGLYFWERRARALDRKDFDAALAASVAENVNTLKLVIPLTQKFTDTMDVVLPLALAQLNRRSE